MLDIESDVLNKLRDIQRHEGGTLGAIVSRLLSQALAQRPKHGVVAFGWTSQTMEAIVDLADKGRVNAILGRHARD
jgi:hypothetical protein